MLKFRCSISRPPRYLLIDGAVHTIVRSDTWQPMQSHACAIDLVKHLFDDPGECLLIGLGGGAIAKSYARDFWKIDAVEIDPVVINVAKPSSI